MRKALLLVLLCGGPLVHGQSSVDPLRSASDRAKEAWRGKDARSVADSDKVFTTVDRMPEPLPDTVAVAGSSGTDPCRSLLPKDLPEGTTVELRFIVERNGEVTSVVAPPGLDPALEDAARCHLGRIRWSPGILGGRAVRTRTFWRSTLVP